MICSFLEEEFPLSEKSWAGGEWEVVVVVVAIAVVVAAAAAAIVVINVVAACKIFALEMTHCSGSL